MTKRKGTLRDIAPLLPFLVLAAFILGCSRSDGPQTVDRFEYYFTDVYKPFFVREGGAYVTRDPIGRPRQSFPVEKSSDTFRVFVLGGSVAQMYDMLAEVRPHLKDVLETVLPGKRAEVVNCGMSGYGITRAGVAAEEMLRYEPDLFVVMSGVNEWNRGMIPRWAARLCALKPLRGACIGYIARFRRFGYSDPATTRKRFMAGERGIVRMARRKGVPTLLATLPVCIRDMPPVLDSHPSEDAPVRRSLPMGNKRFFDAWFLMERGRWKEAAAAFRRFIEHAPKSAFGYYFLARCLDRTGDYRDAARYYTAAQNLHRPVPVMNEGTRRVAEEEGTALADIERLFERVSPQGIPGRRLFEDDVHWDRRFDKLATLEIVKALREKPPGGDELRWDWSWIAEHEKPYLREARTAKLTEDKSWDVFRFRMWEPLRHRELLFSERVLALLETIRLSNPGLLAGADEMKGWIAARLEKNIWDKEAAERLDLWWPVMMGHVGELYRRRRMYSKAVEFFDEALRLDPDLERVRLHKALALAAQGKKKEARAELERVAGLRSTPEFRYWKEAYGL